MVFIYIMKYSTNLFFMTSCINVSTAYCFVNFEDDFVIRLIQQTIDGGQLMGLIENTVFRKLGWTVK